MRSRNVFLFIIAALLLAASICTLTAACGAKGTDTGTAREQTSAAAGKDPVTLRMTYWGSPNEKAAIENACGRFTEKYPWITVEPIQIANDDYNRSLVVMEANGNSPDMGYMTADLGEIWANEGKFTNLYELFAKDKELKKEDFLDNIWYKTDRDYAWGIGTAGECFGLFYNRALLKAAGVDSLPSRAKDAMNWEEFVELAKKLTLDKNGRNAADPAFDSGNIKQFGVMFETWAESLNNFIFSNGGQWVSEDGRSFALNSPETADAIQKIADLINVYHVAPSPLQAKSYPPLNVALQSRLTAMAVCGQWLNIDLGRANADYDIGVLPAMKKSITISVSGATVFFRSSHHTEEAWLLFKWLSNPADSMELYADGLWMPTLKKWYTDPELAGKWADANPAAHPAGFREAILNQFLENAVPQPRFYLKNQAKIEPIVISGLDKVWLGEKTAAEALAEIEAKIRPEFKGRYDVD
jgi:multiple sugar transport system substrate-binding protein